ncbi:hypothetical protein QJS10_CPB14g00059 [Acorus calamus]|uniref:TLC domain-containing protein n=1 Tax=Acorus calamus TaxID=4465 RepID=A0AAV9DB78_ACOCL|nr:hypothetical protein QJS10_CPB14g00059 [Acorus calamus]
MEDYIVQWVVSGVFCWTTIFLIIRNTFLKRSFDFCNRTVSIIHACLAVSMASLSVQDWRCPACPLASKSSPLQRKTLAISLSYLIYDLVCCHFDKNAALDNTIHHLVSILGIGASFIYGSGGSEMVAALWLTEISSPFLHMREILKEFGYRDTDLNLAVDIIFSVTFSLARMGGGPYLAYLTLTADNLLFIKIMAVGLQLVSAFWFYKIVRMVKYKLSRRMAPNKLA